MHKQQPTTIKLVVQLVTCLFSGVVGLSVVMLFAQVMGAGGGDWGDPVYHSKPNLLEYDQARVNFITGIAAGIFLSMQVGFSLYVSQGLKRSHRILVAVSMLVISIAILSLFGSKVFSHPRAY